MNRRTTDSYETTFYLMYGARLDKVRSILLSKNKSKIKGYVKEYTFYLIDVPEFAIKAWKEGVTYGDIQRFKKIRLKFKKLLTSY